MFNAIRHIKLYIFILLILSVSLPIYSNTSVFRGLSVTDGLTDLIINALYKDSLGYMWIGTGNSLERFDGNRLKHYTISGANEKLKRVNAIVETKNNNIWIGNGMGLWKLDKATDELTHIAPETIHYGVNSLLTDSQGTLFIGTDAGLFIYQEGKFSHVLLDTNVLSSANIVNNITFDNKNILWLATNGGLYSLDLSTNKTKFYPHLIDNKQGSYNSITAINSNLFLGTMGQGIIRFNTTTHQFSPYIDVDCNVISSLSSDGKDMLYVGTDGNGVHFISTKTDEITQSYRHDSRQSGSIRSNSVYSLLIDRDGLIWVGFYQLGLDYTLYQNDLFKTYRFAPYFDSHNMPVRTVTKHGNDLLIGSRDGLFFINEKKNIFKSFKSPELRSNMIMSSCEYQGKYYIGTYGGGMYVLDPITLTISDFNNTDNLPFLKGQIFCIKSDSEDNLWIGTSQGLYQYRNGERINHFTSANSKLPEGNIYEIYFDSTKKGWICTENGMCIWDPSSSSLRTEFFPDGFIHKEKIRVVYEDSNHELYFLPDKGSMCISDLSMSQFRRAQPNTLLDGRDGMFIIEDKDGWLWIGTNNGLLRYDKEELFIPYNFIDGIPSAIFTLCPPVKDENDRLWMGNSKGLIYIDLIDESNMKQYNYQPAITDLYVNGSQAEQLTQKEENIYIANLESTQRNLTICLSGFIYTDPSQMSFEYKMDKIDKEWQILSGKSEVNYYNLSPGSYLFKVRYIGNDKSEAQLLVKIPFPILSWFLSTIGILLVVLILIYYLKRKRKTQQTVVTVVEDDTITDKTLEEKYKTNKVNLEECKRLTEKLEIIMQSNKPYTNPDLKIADLASLIGTSAHTMSYLFNQYLNRNYYDYINDYRITEFKSLVEQDEYSKYTLSALAELCGFSSRASFFRYFKKVTGITPNEYIRNIDKTNE